MELVRSASGYQHFRYAQSFAAFGVPRELTHCGGWIVERPVPRSPFRDAMGCYPLFSCQRWAHLPLDLAEMSTDLVALTVVTDPFGDVNEENLRACFDVVHAYKRHFVTDLGEPIDSVVGKTHRRNAANARRQVAVDVCAEPLRMLDTWMVLYEGLSVRHGITGLRRFSRDAFAQQLTVPGLLMFRAMADEQVIGLHLWYVQGDVAYGHLGATNARGYELMASYALYWHALETLRERVRWADLGGAAGYDDSEARTTGLGKFKAGWATGTRQSYVCGRILRPDAYAQLTAMYGSLDTRYFPAYRAGEFVNAAAPSA